VEYKPNNPQFAQQGAVSSSTRILKLNVTTIEKNAAINKRIQKSANSSNVNPITIHIATNDPADTPIHSLIVFKGICFDNSCSAPTCAMADMPPPDK
jgi:hypothetical protein